MPDTPDKTTATEGNSTTEAKAAPAAPAKAPDVVRFTNVTKKFGVGAEMQTAVQDVTFTVEDLPNVGE